MTQEVPLLSSVIRILQHWAQQGEGLLNLDLWVLMTQLITLWPVASSRLPDLQRFSFPLLLGTQAVE